MNERKRINIADYLTEFEPEPSRLARDVRQVILATLPELDEVIKWGHLVYEKKRIICSIVIHKKHVNLQIWRGVELNDPEGKLEGEGKSMRHVKILTQDDINEDYFKLLLHRASELEV